MILLKKLAPRRLSRAIVALAIRSSNNLTQAVRPDQITDRNQNEDAKPRLAIDRGHSQVNKTTTITVETETLLIVRSERRSSRLSAEAGDENIEFPQGQKR